jgi:hypothetical protein
LFARDMEARGRPPGHHHPSAVHRRWVLPLCRPADYADLRA